MKAFAACLLLLAPVEEDGISVRVVGLRSEQGQVLLALFEKEAGFPGKMDPSVRQMRAAIKEKVAVSVFGKIGAGEYAVAVIHDENGDGVLERGIFGMPKEGVGASNNAKGFMGPPKFKDAKFRYSGGKLSIEIKVTYL